MKTQIIENFFTSGWEFGEDEVDVKNTFQMINIGLLLSTAGLLFGLSANILRGTAMLIPLEATLISINILLVFLLRLQKRAYAVISLVLTLEFTFLFLFLVYVSEPQELRHIWLFTYPLILLYLKNGINRLFWLLTVLFFLLVAPLQPFLHVKYSLFQVIYISFVLVTVSIIIYFYQKKMDEAKRLILEQKDMLKKQLQELSQKDKIMTMQSKQAVMGEMISMIAHQWRQPLSTVTLSISNLQVKRLLGKKIQENEFDKVLEDINTTIVYLSDTIDDFQTYFHPKKEINRIAINELMTKAINFVKPRLKETNIEIIYTPMPNIVIQTYINEIIQVLLNILNNAIDELIAREIKNPKVIIYVQNLEDTLVLEIEDNAGGIKKEHIDSIFEPYFSTKGKNGTGLGLYMSQMIMQKQFHSSIEVSSQNNKTSFILKIPKKLA